MGEPQGFSHLWNDMPFDERLRLMPFEIESQIRHLKGARAIIVSGHNQTLAKMDKWIANLERSLRDHMSEQDR